MFTPLCSHSCGHTVVVTQLCSHSNGHIVVVTQLCSHSYVHTFVLTQLYSQSCGQIVAFTQLWSHSCLYSYTASTHIGDFGLKFDHVGHLLSGGVFVGAQQQGHVGGVLLVGGQLVLLILQKVVPARHAQVCLVQLRRDTRKI